jgi:hypothetical protein
VKVRIEGRDLPGREFCSAGERLQNVHVGPQVGKEPTDLVRADVATASWDLEVRVLVTDDGALDFRGPAVHGRRDERFLYLTWGDVGADGTFAMFRRAKLMLDSVDAELVGMADAGGRTLVATIVLTDGSGHPICARVGPPELTWSVR